MNHDWWIELARRSDPESRDVPNRLIAEWRRLIEHGCGFNHNVGPADRRPSRERNECTRFRMALVLRLAFEVILAIVLASVLTQRATPPPPEMTGLLDQHLTASAPSAVVGCTSATQADRELLPDADARERHVWSCSMMCSAPLGQRGALLVERRWRQPVLFLDSNNDGAFDPTERHEFPRTGDLHIRIAVTIGLFTETPSPSATDGSCSNHTAIRSAGCSSNLRWCLSAGP
jgi:hypothetical protein